MTTEDVIAEVAEELEYMARALRSDGARLVNVKRNMNERRSAAHLGPVAYTAVSMTTILSVQWTACDRCEVTIETAGGRR